MSDLDGISLKVVRAIAKIDPDNLPGGKTQAMAQAQLLVRDAIESQLTAAESENEALRRRVAELEDNKHKLKWKLAHQAMHHVRLHNRWVCGELEAPEEESIVNPFIYAETQVWWAIGNEADGFAKELEAEDEDTQLENKDE